MTSKQKVSIVTLGCAKNTADTDNLARLLKAKGHEVVSNPEDAGAIVVHTCSFIEAAKKESIEAILQASQVKGGEKKQLIVTGCLVQQHGKEIFDDLPEVDAFLGTGQLGQIPGLLDNPRARFIDRANPGGFMDPDVPMPREIEGATAYLRLSEGCRHPCTFCVIPKLRGTVQSRSEETILNEARDLASRGVEELVIIGQDTGDWGRDFARPQPISTSSPADSGRGSMGSPLTPAENDAVMRLPNLLKRLSQIPGIRWIRVMYMHPASMTDELIDVFAEQPDKFPYLDMPLQHIDTEMLAQMQRKSSEASIRELIGRLRARAPQLSLRTTFIVGFPGETDEQFGRLLQFVKEGHFDYLGTFAYSKEEGTAAGVRADQLPDDLKQERLHTLTDAYYETAHRKALARVGTTETLLIEDEEDDEVLARSRREAPGIDAIIRLPKTAVRQGRFIMATLTGYNAYEFTANPIEIFNV